MLIRMFKSGRGAGSGPVRYCVDTIVKKHDPVTRRVVPGEMVVRDPAPEILKGDEDRCQMLIDSTDRRWKYSSGVIAFADSDAPSHEKQLEVIEDFERLVFAGLDFDQYDSFWVRHTHEGNVELHFIVPRTELTTGKALNIAPPGYQGAFDAFRNYWNFKENWADPDDPSRARLVSQDDHVAKFEAARLAAGLEASDDPKKTITDFLLHRVSEGLITDRAGIVDALREIGEVTRQGKDYVSVKPAGFTKTIRLKGELYGAEFSVDKLSRIIGEAARTKEVGGKDSDREVDPRRVSEARAELERCIESRVKYNHGRYRKRDESLEQSSLQRFEQAVVERDKQSEKEAGGPVRGVESDRSEDSGNEPSTAMGEAAADRDSSLFGHLSRELGADALLGIERSEQSNPDQRTARNPEPASVWGSLSQKYGVGAVPGAARRQVFGARLDSFRQASSEAYKKITKTIRGVYDRVRAGISEIVGAALEAISSGHESAVGTSVALAAASDVIVRSGEQINRASREFVSNVDRAGRVLKMKRNDELDRFKSEINLVEFAGSMGYEIDKKESGRSSVVMRGPGDDKIIVATSQSGHGVYFSVRDDADNGSIIDFVQRRQGLNMGEVRKELRPWLDSGIPTRSGRPVLRQPVEKRPLKPAPSSADRQQVLAAYAKMRPAGDHPYLINERKISARVLQDSRFASSIRIDQRGNAVFPHFDEKGLSGYEMKNSGFTGFSKHGEKAIWFSSNANSCDRLVIVESAIDALSHAQLVGRPGDGYFSIGGNPSPQQLNLLSRTLEGANARGAVVVLATDNDRDGEKLASKIQAVAPAEMKSKRDRPDAKDWNEQIKHGTGLRLG